MERFMLLPRELLTATGIDAAGAGSKVVVGVPTSARLPNGGIVEREVATLLREAITLF